MPVDESTNAGWALALSGGGLRATLFHLGVLRRLRESGDLQKVRAIFSVSGGSILAAHARLNWASYTGSAEQFDEAAKEIESICKRDIRGRVVRRSLLCWLLLLPLWFRVIGKIPGLGWCADQARRMTPVLHILATSLNTGTVAVFEDDRFRIRSQGFQPVPAQRTPIALAVAASSAYPALFGPVRIDAESLVLFNGKFDGQYDLSDGGLYDNLGVVEACDVEMQTCTEFERLIVSDAGAAITSATGTSAWSAIRRAIRTTDILMARMADGAMAKIANNPRVHFLSIHALVPGSSTSENSQSSIGAVRTDLDVFSWRERKMIQQHGYEVAAFEVHREPPTAQQTSDVDPLHGSQRSSIASLFHWRDWTTWASLTLACVWFLGIAYSLGYPDLRRDYQKHQVSEYLRVAADAGQLATLHFNAEEAWWHLAVETLAPTEYGNAASYHELSLASHFPPLRWMTRVHNTIASRLHIDEPFPPLNDAMLVEKRIIVRLAFGTNRQDMILEYMHEIGDRWSAEIPEFTATRDNMYLEVTRLAERIAETPNYQASTRNQFYTYYWGKLASVESRAGGNRNCSVETAMVHFGNWLDYWSKKLKRPPEMDPVRDNLIRSLVREQKTGPGGDPVDDEEAKCRVPDVPKD